MPVLGLTNDQIGIYFSPFLRACYAWEGRKVKRLYGKEDGPSPDHLDLYDSKAHQILDR